MMLALLLLKEDTLDLKDTTIADTRELIMPVEMVQMVTTTIKE
jgi:hypothetical protein